MEAHMLELEEKMRESARQFDFKQAAVYRDRLQELKNRVA
jgi:excinuclease UvrABC helicase subunit UvrB